MFRARCARNIKGFRLSRRRVNRTSKIPWVITEALDGDRRMWKKLLLSAVLGLGIGGGLGLLLMTWVLDYLGRSAAATMGNSAMTSTTAHATNASLAQTPPPETRFLVVAGGGAPSYNEIALEKNVLYFQRTLQVLGFNPAIASIFFANGNDGRATIRYLDGQGQERFKAPQIPHLQGASTITNVTNWLRQNATQGAGRSLFFYFTGHGRKNRSNLDNNAMILWNEELLSVQRFSSLLDQSPQVQPVVAVMVQCYSGSFANLIYQGGNPNRPLAAQNRCGFFATLRHLPSVGCTPEVNEADYEDYSSSFFAGLSGRTRTGQVAASADYDRNGKVSYREAHAFVKVDSVTTDLPISTLEAWMERETAPVNTQTFLQQPINTLLPGARPERRHVIQTLSAELGFSPQRSFAAQKRRPANEHQATLQERLRMELLHVARENLIRRTGTPTQLSTLNRLLDCEGGSWQPERAGAVAGSS